MIFEVIKVDPSCDDVLNKTIGVIDVESNKKSTGSIPVVFKALQENKYIDESLSLDDFEFDIPDDGFWCVYDSDGELIYQLTQIG
jgi:hypothetical protein